MGAQAWDVLWKPGLFRLAAASDGSREVQMMNCGTWGAAAAVRFGNYVVEFINKANGQMGIFLNGKELADGVEWPVELDNLFIDNSHRKATTNQINHQHQSAAQVPNLGGCVDDPGGQVYIDVTRAGRWRPAFSVMVEAEEGSFTTRDTDKDSLCNIDAPKRKAADGGRWYTDFESWDVGMVAPEDSLFIGSGTMACDACHRVGWQGAKIAQTKQAAAEACAVDVPKKQDTFDVASMCKTHNVPVERAQAACVHLQNDPHFYDDCQLDFCATDANPEVVAEAENDQHLGQR